MFLLWLACTSPVDSDEAAHSDSDLVAPPRPQLTVDYPLDDLLTVSDLQAAGTHNSYHIEPDNPVDDSHRYTHAPLATQLEEFGVRQLELDLHLHKDLGLQVFHLPGVDPETTCLAFADCLEEIQQWSWPKPGHVPVVVWLELKDDIDALAEDYLEMGDHIDEVEAAIREVFPDEQLLTPDDVRGDSATLPQALAAQGWPVLGDARGRVIFSLLENGSYKDSFVAPSDVLAGRVMFVDEDDPTKPWAATIKTGDGAGNEAQIQAWVEAGMLVTAFADELDDSAEDNLAAIAGALASGAQYISTDRPNPALPGEGFAIEDGPVACNPVTAPEDCTSAAVEDLEG
jgi:hypothetical protein